MKNNMVKVIGADLGNDSHKIVFSHRQHHRIKNSVSQRMTNETRKNLNVEMPLDNFSLNEMDVRTQDRIFNDLDVVITSSVINGRYFVGELASKNGENEVEVGTPKADNPNIIIPLITLLALDIPSDQSVGRFKVVCGLPITEFTSDRERYREMVKGEYDIEFKTDAITNRKNRKVIIEDVLVVPEGVAVVINQMLNDTATGFRNAALREGHRGVIDIGAFTTDIPVIINGKPDSDASDGISEGIANYLDKIVKYVNETYSAKMTRSQLVDHLEKDKLVLSIRKNMVDLRPFIDEQFEIFSKKIVSKVDNLWANHFEIEDFFVVGGGAKALKDALTTEMNKRNIQLTFLEGEDPQLQNALGYWKYGKQKFGA